ncbi:unnamed protein product [Leptosia nina]|uniref:Uncharacterized protein n=1 Tax=Leptosia nina TaxID=320188 RepID=A0AAV1J2H4_9NEOP
MIQVGSCCKMLSPLNIKASSVPFEEGPTAMFSEISPEMIYEALRRLSMWRQHVETSAILDYIGRNYPVNPDKSELLMELLDKLVIAVIVGIVCQSSTDTWYLSCALERRKIKKTHVTLFWKVYSDTLQPISKRQNTTSQNTNSQNGTLRVFDSEIL